MELGAKSQKHARCLFWLSLVPPWLYFPLWKRDQAFRFLGVEIALLRTPERHAFNLSYPFISLERNFKERRDLGICSIWKRSMLSSKSLLFSIAKGSLQMHRFSGTWLSCPYFVFAIKQIQGPSKTHKTDENKFKTDTRKLFFFFFFLSWRLPLAGPSR